VRPGAHADRLKPIRLQRSPRRPFHPGRARRLSAGGIGERFACAVARPCFALPEQDLGTFEVGRRGRFQPQLGPRPGSLAAVLFRRHERSGYVIF